MVISEKEYNKKHRRYRFREMGPYQWEEEIMAINKKSSEINESTADNSKSKLVKQKIRLHEKFYD